jgi:hypothetical protein
MQYATKIYAVWQRCSCFSAQAPTIIYHVPSHFKSTIHEDSRLVTERASLSNMLPKMQSGVGWLMTVMLISSLQKTA